MSAWSEDAGEKPFTWSYWIGRIDLRPIALFRIVISLFVLWDLTEFGFDLRAWFSDEGVLPRAAMITQWGRTTRFCLLDAFGSPGLVWVYWALSVIATLAMLVGYRTRIASVAVWVLSCGYQERIPPLFDGSDTVLRMMLFWHMFTSSGNVWSADALLARARETPLAQFGAALPVRLTQLQIGWIYFCSIFYKLQGQSWHNGTAVHYALHLTRVFARPWDTLIADSAPICQFITYFTLVLEASFIFLINSPVWHRQLRGLAIFCGIGLHAGIFMTINVGHFSYLMPICYLPMLFPEWTQKLVDVAARLIGPVRLEALAAHLRRLPEPSRRGVPAWLASREREAWGLLAAVAVAVSWYSLPVEAKNLLPQPVQSGIEYASLWSNWNMFAPEPLSDNYHLSMPAEYEDGTTADLFGGPKDGHGDVRGFWFTRWWKYLENVTGGGDVLPLEYGRFLCRERNFHLKPGQPRLYTFTLLKDNLQIPPIGQPWAKEQRQTVWVHRCYDKPSEKAQANTSAASIPRQGSHPHRALRPTWRRHRNRSSLRGQR